MAKRHEAPGAKTPSLQASADSLGSSGAVAGTPGGDLAEIWKSLAGIGLPAEALAAAQGDYIAQAATIWNRMLMPAGSAPALSDRRFAGPDWAATVAPQYFNYRKTSIYAGSNEIQHNIMAKMVLGL